MLLTYIREAVRNLYAAKQRTFLALIGIGIGIGSVIALVSIGIIWGEEMMRGYEELNVDMLNIEKSWDDKNKHTYISLQDSVLLPKYIRSITEVIPTIRTRGNYYFNDQNDSIRLLGITESYFDFNKLQLKEGRFISDLDYNQSYVVIGNKALEEPPFETFKGKLVGLPIKIKNRIYTIIGVLEKNDFDWRSNRAIIMPISTMQRNLRKKQLDVIIARMKPKVNYLLAIEEVKQFFAKRKKMIVEVWAEKEWIEYMEKAAKMRTLLLGAISSISLLVGGVGIMNVMLTSVMERRREIGILRAIGARQRDIRRQFLTEAIILSLTGGALGIGLGIFASYLVCWFNEWQFLISNFAILLGVGVSSIVGIFFGFYPAYKAAKLNPITALRSD
ncbi:ABC transporter permease [Thiotrichales bacterium HSG1]|nr:ABC transporter permease [Thiotrichales bacterium HSG1]